MGEDFKPPADWGVKLAPDIKWVEKYYCDRCSTSLDNWGDMIVGYTNIVLPSLIRPTAAAFGTIIIQCPNCTKMFWLHVDKSTIEGLIFLKKFLSANTG